MKSMIDMPEKLLKLAEIAEDKAAPYFKEVERIEEYNTQKMLLAFAEEKISAAHLSGTTGYGYDDRGRDTLDKLFARVFGAEDALVRHNFVSGTHAIVTALFGVLRPNDTLLSITGKPYDTLEEAIGIRGEGKGSLKDWGVNYSEVELTKEGKIDTQAVLAKVKGVKLAYIQRSRGYSLRPAINVDEIADVTARIKEVSPNTIVMVDNCYGEFVEREEPTDRGADLIVGSLIKNPGGAIAKTGGYIAGKHELIEMCADRLTCPGMGREVGCTLDELRNMYLGFFMSPSVVASAIKTGIFATALFNEMGYTCYPALNEKRTDIITALCLENPQTLLKFCRGIQAGSPIDSFVSPEPWAMPGYESEVVMAAGAFTMGASIELSADAPMREPFAVWMQGGITYPSGKTGVMLAAKEILK